MDRKRLLALMGSIFIMAVFQGLLYLIGAFVFLDLNISHWHIIGRCIFAALSITILIMVLNDFNDGKLD